MAYFKNQPTTVIVPANTTLSASYNDTNYTGFVEALSAITIYVEYHPAGIASSLQFQLEFGPDVANLYPEGSLLDTDTSGESQVKLHTYNLSANGSIAPIRRRLIFDVADKQFRISFKETTVGASGIVSVIMTIKYIKNVKSVA